MKYILTILMLICFTGSVNSYAADKTINMSVYLFTPEYLTILDTKMVQKLTSREGQIKLENIKPFHQLRALFEQRIKLKPELVNYPVNRKLFKNWKPKIKFGFGGPTVKSESIKELKKHLDDPAVKYIIITTPGIKFLSRVSPTARVYFGNGIIYDSSTTKLFSSYLVCVIDLKTELSLDCERFFTSQLFISSDKISVERLAEIKEYIELDITDKPILNKINQLLEKDAISDLNNYELKQLYIRGLQNNKFSIDEITDRTNYLIELINQPTDAVQVKSLPQREQDITRQLISMLKNKLPVKIDSLLDSTVNYISDEF
ncbi:hypothetical protein MNBD_GAMMA21-1688 [hydrothermal vent metagenome]|uniref:Uncharacterized protein n=1 Tax=hydrothermal vent metagenome TaxID=652676 RepID=A0A3B1B056_9ZZZZ